MTGQDDNNSIQLSGTGALGLQPLRRALKTLGQGRYHIMQLAGRGGMSQVYHAYDTLADRDVAIKVLSLELFSEETFLARFQRESELMRDLNHPNILKAYDYGQENDIVFLVMSYYGGGTLKDRIGRGSEGHPLSLGLMADYLDGITAGLGYAHARNIVHRDIKPSNVLLHHASGQVVVSDFGIAKALSNTNPNRTGTIMGTPLYMSPEQFLDRVDFRSDIYSLGVLLYQMLSGQVPFKGEGIGFKHLSDPVPPLDSWGRAYPSAIEEVVMKALAKRPDDRYQRVEELAVAFRQAATEFARSATRDIFAIQPPALKDGAADRFAAQASLTELTVITPSQLKLSGDPAVVSVSAALEKLPESPAGSGQADPSGPTGTVTRPYLPIGQTGRIAPAARSLNGAAIQPATKAGPRPVKKKPRKKGILLLLALGLLGLLAGGALAYSLSVPRPGPAAPPGPVAQLTTVIVPGVVTTAPPASPTATASSPGTSAVPTATVTTAAAITPATTAPGPGVSVRPNAVAPSVLVAFTSLDSSNGLTYIYTYDALSGNLTPLTFTGRDSLPVWTPDGAALVFQRERGASLDLYRIGVNGSGETLLVQDAMNPEIARKSGKLVYINLNDNEIYVTAATSPANPVRLTSTGGRSKRGPVWSFDESRIAFAMTDERNIYQIYVVDATKPGSQPRQLTRLQSENALWPTFSPDGARLVFSTNDNNPDPNQRLPLDIYVVNSDGSNLKKIVGNTGHNSHPVWVADGRGKDGSRIYFNSDRGVDEVARIWVMNSDGSEPEPFVPHKKGPNELKVEDYAANIYLRGG